jgi:hypothetical protein
MILSIMLVALGFLTAMLLALLLAPAFWRRAERLTARRLEQTMPMSIAEAEAERDQIRAGYAIIIRRLEAALSQEKMRAARQLVKISRLQMDIADLDEKTDELRGQLDAEHNAASVLRRTIATRVPALNHAAQDARQLVQVRDREIATIVNRLRHREEALAIAQRTTEMQQAEIARLRQAMEMSGAQNSGRFKLRPTEWTIHDYRAEYDRLNVELSKLRERLSVAYDREANQITQLRTELQKFADQIVSAASALPESEPPRSIRHEQTEAEEQAADDARIHNTDTAVRSIDAMLSDTRERAGMPAVREPQASASPEAATSRSALTRAATAPARLARGAMQTVAGLGRAKRGAATGADPRRSRQYETAPEPGEVSAAKLLGGGAVAENRAHASSTGEAGARDEPATAPKQSSPTGTPSQAEHREPETRRAGPRQPGNEPNLPRSQPASMTPDSAADAEHTSLYDRYRSAKPASGGPMDEPVQVEGWNTATPPEAGEPAIPPDGEPGATSSRAGQHQNEEPGGTSRSSGNGPATTDSPEAGDAANTEASSGSLLDRLKHLPENETR